LGARKQDIKGLIVYISILFAFISTDNIPSLSTEPVSQEEHYIPYIFLPQSCGYGTVLHRYILILDRVPHHGSFQHLSLFFQAEMIQ